MEFFNKAKAVRLKSHLDKYLAADDDEKTVRQTRNGSSKKARWIVELVDRNPHVIRLKSCHGRYLTASDEAYLLGMTGKKVLQTIPDKKNDASIEWEPIKEGYRVKLRTVGGKYLRANGATPPWRNSITHDIPHRTATQDWVMWDVDAVDISVLDDEYLPSHASSFSSVQEDDYWSSDSPVSNESGSQMRWPSVVSSHRRGRQDGMDFFQKAKSVRLLSHLGKYLVADDDEQTVRQSRNASSHRARWAVEFVEGKHERIRLKTCHGLYLTAAETPFLLGMTGKKVIQTLPGKMTDESIEWHPVKEGLNVKLMTSEGKFLRGNGGAPPWRNSVTHDVPQRTATQNWVLWGVEVVDITISVSDSDSDSDTGSTGLSPDSSFSSLADDYSGSPDIGSGAGSPMAVQRQQQSIGSVEDSTRKTEGRLIYYYVCDDDGNVNDAIEGPSFQFKGHGLPELTQKLEEETGIENIIVCSRNRINGKLYPLRLALPPNNAIMHVVVVPSTSRVTNDFMISLPSST